VPINAISSFLCSTFSAEYYIVICQTKATFTKSVKNKHHLTKPGGLNSRDQSRSRSRTSLVLRPTFLKCQDYPSRRDRLFFSRSSFSKLRFFNQNLSLSRYLSRSSIQIETPRLTFNTFIG